MNIVTRKLICSRLKVSRRTCYTLFPATRRGIVLEASVIEKLNKSASNCDRLTMIPTLLTPAEAARTIVVDGQPITAQLVGTWLRRAALRAPHFKLSSHCMRVRADEFAAWAEKNVGKKARVA